MKTILAEKPSVAREIARIVGATEKREGYLTGNGYNVTWAFGYLVTPVWLQGHPSGDWARRGDRPRKTTRRVRRRSWR